MLLAALVGAACTEEPTGPGGPDGAGGADAGTEAGTDASGDGSSSLACTSAPALSNGTHRPAEELDLASIKLLSGSYRNLPERWVLA